MSSSAVDDGGGAAARQLTLGTVMRAGAREWTDRVAVVDGRMRVPFGELDRRTDQLANALSALGVRRQDRVATLLLDGLPAIELLIAIGKLGAVALPLNWRLAGPELTYILESAAPRLLLHSETFDRLVPAENRVRRLVLPDATSPSSTYEDLVNTGAPLAPDCVVRSDDPLFMLYTSGTTGRPKGCLQSHAGTVLAALAFAARRGLSSTDRLLSTSPLFHVGGLSHLFSALAVGATTVVVPRGLKPEDTLRLASSEGCTFGSPNDGLVEGLIVAQRRLALPLRLRTLTRGASLTPAAQILAIREHLGARVVGGYGQSEVGGFATMIDDIEMLEHPSALGAPLPHLEICVLDSTGVPDPHAIAGELGVRGRSVMLGYWNDPDATQAAVRDGWLRTGDLVRRDSEGRLHFDGRSKELVKSGGENVYPGEVEQVLLMHPAILDAAIIGVPHPRWGEAVKACIVVRPGETLTAAEVVAWCRQHIAGYKRPRFVEYLDSIPRDHLGKIQRQVLRQRAVAAAQAVD